MKKLLVLSLQLGFTSTVTAEVANYYLLGSQGVPHNVSFVVPMQSLEACEASGQKFGDRKEWFRKGHVNITNYVCVKAK